jgi:hypothetical protein
MKLYKMNYLFAMLGCMLLSSLLFAGCAAKTGSSEVMMEQPGFEADVDRMIDDLLAKQRHSSMEMAPVTVMPGSLRAQVPFTRLEEYVMGRLAKRLRENHEVYSMTRQNWFEFRDNRPLTFQTVSPAEQQRLRSLVVYEVVPYSDKYIGKIEAWITAIDAQGNAISGLMASAAFNFSAYETAGELLNAEPHANPYPEGLEERPYTSLDRMSFNLAAELVDVYREGITLGDRTAASDDVKVVLLTKPVNGVADSAIQAALQQAIVANKGFTCTISQDDFGTILQQLDFYSKNRVFNFDETVFEPGTVLLMAEVFKHQDGDKTGVALRGAWRVGPVVSKTGGFIPTSVAGTYLSGFTAKAYHTGVRLDTKRTWKLSKYNDKGFKGFD